MKLVIYTSNCVGNAKNCLYPTRREITSGAELAEAVKLDHVCAEYADNYRSIDNFRVSNAVYKLPYVGNRTSALLIVMASRVFL